MTQDSDDVAILRRHFLKRTAKAVLCAAAASGVGIWFHDISGPQPFMNRRNGARFPGFSIPGVERKMSIVRGNDASSRTDLLLLALKILGGMEAFIKKGDRVLLKVNAAFASPPVLSATTHPELVYEVSRLCFKAGAASVIVADNPINDPKSCFLLTGIAEAARRAGAGISIPERDSFKPVTVPGAGLIRRWPVLWKPMKGITKLVGMAPVKDHHRSGASMTMKNWYGLLGGRRSLLHQDIHCAIKELAMMVTPTLIILDGMTTMMTNGPTGGSLSDLKKTNTMVVGTDQVAVDAFGASLLNKKPVQLPFIEMAAAAGAGTLDYRSLNPVEVRTG